MSLKCLEILGVKDLFSMMITSSEPLPHKPDPASLLKIMETYKIKKEEALMIGDTGFDALLLRLVPRIYEKDKMPDYFVDSYDELYELIHKI